MTAQVSTTTPQTIVREIEPILVQRVEAQTVELNSTSTVRSYVEQEAIAIGVDPNLAISIVKCESGFIPQQSQILTEEGEREDSWGIWQIHLPDHPTVTREKAMDVEFSTKYSLDLIKKGEANLWSCYK